MIKSTRNFCVNGVVLYALMEVSIKWPEEHLSSMCNGIDDADYDFDKP